MKKRSIWQRALAVLLAVAMCLVASPVTSWAELIGASGTATLEIAYDSDGDGACDLVLNKVYGFHDGATLGDLFAAAKAAGDIGDYAFKGGYIDSVTLSDGTVIATKPDFSEYWASYKNGAYASSKTDCTESDALASGDAFQFGYEGYQTGPAAYDWSKAPAPAVSAQVAGQKSDPSPDPTPARAYAYDAKTASMLTGNLAARFVKGGSDAAISNATVEGALALNSLGRGSEIDSAAIVKSFEGYSDANDGRAMGAGQYGKYILALTAAGVDCTKVTLSDGTAHNLVSEMEALVDKGGLSVYDEVWVLPVYRSYADASGRTAKLIDDILASVDSDGLFGNATYGCDTQTSSQAILALLPYRNVRSDVSAAIKKAESAILALQNEDGGFGYSASYSDSNLDATGEVVVALTALGHNCADGSDVTTSNGSTPIGWLCGMADANLAGFLDNSAYNESQSSAAILLGLAADAGRQAAGGAYDVYALKTVKAAETPKTPETPETPKAPEQPSSTPRARCRKAPSRHERRHRHHRRGVRLRCRRCPARHRVPPPFGVAHAHERQGHRQDLVRAGRRGDPRLPGDRARPPAGI